MRLVKLAICTGGTINFIFLKISKQRFANSAEKSFFLPDTLKMIDKYVLEKKTGKKTISVPVIEMSDMAII